MIEWLLGVLAFGGIVFWFVVGAFALLAAKSASKDDFGWATVFLLSPLVLTFFVHPEWSFTAVLWWLVSNWHIGVALVVAYALTGAITSAGYWFSRLRRMGKSIAAERERLWTNFLVDAAFPRKDEDNFRAYVKRFRNFPPDYNDHKAQIIAWIAVWWAYWFWEIARFPWELGNYVFALMSGVFQRMADSAGRKYVTVGLPPAPPVDPTANT